MNNYTADELQAALRPIASLISKSEKAQQKLKLGTWQHSMLRDNLKALHLASALMGVETTEPQAAIAKEDLQAALQSFADMIRRTEQSQEKFAPGTAQHTLQRNRLAALRIAESYIQSALDNPS